MIAYRTFRGHAQDWTPQHDDLLLTYAGQWRLVVIAKKLGRTPLACKQRLSQHGIALREAATRRKGMSIKDVGDALGVSKNHVQKWVRIGWLASSSAFGVEKRYTSIDPDDLLRFLRERGALLSYLAPDRDWIEEVADARADLQSRLIAGPDLARQFYVNRGHLYYLRTRHDFPDPALVLNGSQPDYYDRAAVGAWLAAHPQYQTRAMSDPPIDIPDEYPDPTPGGPEPPEW